MSTTSVDEPAYYVNGCTHQLFFKITVIKIKDIKFNEDIYIYKLHVTKKNYKSLKLIKQKKKSSGQDVKITYLMCIILYVLMHA